MSLLAFSGVLLLMFVGCTRYREDLGYDHSVEYSWSEPGTPGEFSLFEGVDGNLESSGRAFAICEAGATVELFTAACIEAGKELVPATTDATRWPVYEIKSSKTMVGEPKKAPL